MTDEKRVEFGVDITGDKKPEFWIVVKGDKRLIALLGLAFTAGVALRPYLPF